VITTILLVVLGLALVFVLVQMMRAPSGSKAARQAPAAQPLAAAGSAELFGARPGDVISIHGAAEDFADLDFTVDRRSAYQTGARRWIDLSGEFRGRRVYLEVQPGPEPEVIGLLDSRRLSLADLHATEEQLAEMDVRQDPSQSLEFEGRRWRYESSRELGYFENEQGAGEGLYRWIFTEQDGARVLCVEKWEGAPFDVRIARRLNPQDIDVYKAA
jgi:hypothetical protein